MRFSEVFLRLGAGLVAWILLLTYFIWLGVVGRVGCGPDGDELHRLVLVLAPFALGSAFLLRATRALGDVHSILRWGMVLLGLLLPSAVHAVWTVTRKVWVAKEGICGPNVALLWEQAWPVAQVVVLAAIVVLVLQNWRNQGQQ